MGINLLQGQVVRIQGKDYVVQSMVSYIEDNKEWQEYIIQDEQSITRILCVEKCNGDIVYSVFREYCFALDASSKELDVNGQSYHIENKGSATVQSTFGDITVKKLDNYNYVKYLNEAGNSVIVIKNWNGITSNYMGMILNSSDIETTYIVKECETKTNLGYKLYESDPQKRRVKEIKSILYIAAAIFLLVLLDIKGYADDRSIMKQIDKSFYFIYVTKISDIEIHKIAKIYTTNLDYEYAIKRIIKEAPDGIEKIVSYSEKGDDGVGIFTKNEFAYVYIAEDGEVLIQVSKKDYVCVSNKLYHATNTTSKHYHDTLQGSSYSIPYLYTDYLRRAKEKSHEYDYD